VALARALITQPALVLADEPTGSLDATTREEVADILFDAPTQWGCSLLVVTHEEAVAQRAAKVADIKECDLVFR
jgi:predicted ABC-type transport system involved in lysophospholipase L1 biosynthesis ATPase subunit